jgi:hypothetical protein
MSRVRGRYWPLGERLLGGKVWTMRGDVMGVKDAFAGRLVDFVVRWLAREGSLAREVDICATGRRGWVQCFPEFTQRVQ